jgi:hypothetical protein
VSPPAERPRGVGASAERDGPSVGIDEIRHVQPIIATDTAPSAAREERRIRFALLRAP